MVQHAAPQRLRCRHFADLRRPPPRLLAELYLQPASASADDSAMASLKSAEGEVSSSGIALGRREREERLFSYGPAAVMRRCHMQRLFEQSLSSHGASSTPLSHRYGGGGAARLAAPASSLSAAQPKGASSAAAPAPEDEGAFELDHDATSTDISPADFVRMLADSMPVFSTAVERHCQSN